MSHIETGNTKLSLQVFVDIAVALEIQTDDLLADKQNARKFPLEELSLILDSCTSEQLRAIADIAKTTKTAMDKYLED